MFELSLFILSLALMTAGLTMMVGLGWAMIIFDLFGGSASGDYADAQRTHKGAKSIRHKVLGLISLLAGIALLIYFINTP